MKTIALILLCSSGLLAQGTKPERPTAISPEFASVKDNIPVKKEKFGEKMSRIKADGNSIGVYLRLEPVHGSTTAGDTLGFKEPIIIPGEYMDESLVASGAEFVQELNHALGTTDIELIDINKIPYREGSALAMASHVDNFWATKYKVVFFFNVDPRLETIRDSFDSPPKFNAVLNLVNSLIIMEYIGGPTSKDQDIVVTVNQLGTFRSPTFVQQDDIKDRSEEPL